MTDQPSCPVCGHEADPADTACRYCGAGLPSAKTVATPPDAQPATAAAHSLADELREALAPRIHLLRPLGEGGMGHVWLARDPALKRLVAVKVLHPELANDPTSRARFAREAEAAAAVAHPGVVSVYQVGDLPRSGTTFFVMQYVEGKSLQDEIKPGAAMPESRVRRIVGEIASALAAAHARGLVHRDIKPANVMLDADSGRVVVLDFGISAALERRASPAATRLTAEGHSIGTPMYMSPEQATAAEVTPKSDVYSLGVVAFELATGRPPFTGTTHMELVAAHIKDVPPRIGALRPDVDPQLAELIDRCLAKDPAKRPTAADIARALQPAAHSLIEWPPPGLEPLRGQGAELAATMGAAAGVGLLFFLTLRTQPMLVSPLWYVEVFLAFDGTPIWFFTLGLCLLTLVLLAPLATLRTWNIADRLRGGRRAGYPWPVLLDVAWDQRTDTGALINGSGPYALVEETERRKVLEFRRRQAMFAAASIILAIASPLIWLAGWSGGWADNRGPLLPGPEVLVLFLPVLAGLLGLWWCARPEAKLHARLGLARGAGERQRSQVRSELVTAWLATARHARGRAARRVPPVVLVLMPAVLMLALIVGAATVLAVTFTVSAELSAARDDARTIIQSMRVDSLRPIPWQRLDSIIGTSARLPDTRATPDLEGARLLVSAALYARAISPVWIADPAQWIPDNNMAASEFLANRVLRGLPGSVTPGDLERLARATLTPRLLPWRRLARSGPLPMLWPYRAGLSGVNHEWEVPGWQLDNGMRVLADRNGAAAVLALAQGDKATALERVRENIAVGRALMRVPVWNSMRVSVLNPRGGSGIIDQGARFLTEIGRATQDPVVAAEGERLRLTVSRYWSDHDQWRSGSVALMADPNGTGMLSYLRDSTLAPFTRIEAARAIVYGYCLNAREILFGVEARRRATLAEAEAALSDLDGSDDLLRLVGNDLEALITDPSAAAQAMGATPRPGDRPLGWIGLRGIRDRLAFCWLWYITG